MFRASRNRVATSSSDGKLEKSRGRLTYMLTSTMTSAAVMFMAIRKSSSAAGTGTTIIMMMPTTPIGTAYWLRLRVFNERSSIE